MPLELYYMKCYIHRLYNISMYKDKCNSKKKNKSTITINNSPYKVMSEMQESSMLDRNFKVVWLLVCIAIFRLYGCIVLLAWLATHI